MWKERSEIIGCVTECCRNVYRAAVVKPRLCQAEAVCLFSIQANHTILVLATAARFPGDVCAGGKVIPLLFDFPFILVVPERTDHVWIDD